MPKLLVYNIRKEKYAVSLSASGVANRWNLDNQFVLYTGSSLALATLELVVHKSAIAVNSNYKIMVISLNISEKDIYAIEIGQLPKYWKSMKAYSELQKIGSEWYRAYQFLIMKVPSAIVPQEFNYLINTHHPDFKKKVKLESVEDFLWDERLF